MSKLLHVHNSEISCFKGYIDAAQHVFKKGELDACLEAALFEVTDNSVTDEEVIKCAYDGPLNSIEYRSECSVEVMEKKVNTFMTVTKKHFSPPYVFAELLETDLREGYWRHLKTCFDYKHARVVEIGYHVPYVNIGHSFTYILYTTDRSRCMLLVGNTSD